MPFRLKVIAGPDQGKTFNLPPAGAVTIGRGEADVAINDVRVSRAHFRLTTISGQIRLRDLGSKTGTVVNNAPAVADQVLRAGDLIVVGDTFLQLIHEGAVGPGSSPQAPRPAASLPVRATPGAPALTRPAHAASPVKASMGKLHDLANTQFGPFALGNILGVGQTGVVFRALDTRDRSEAALKVFMPAFSKDEEAVQRFIRAAKTIHPFRHRHLVDLHGAGRTDGYCWLSMELIEGPSVAWLVQQAHLGQGDWRTALRVGQHVARALTYLHGKQVLHRNLTPENLLMCRADGLVKVGDLMTAKAQEGNLARDITTTGEVVGDLRYLAPERTLGGPAVGDARTDLYNLGAILYALLTGRPPIEGTTLMEAVEKIRFTLPAPVRLLEPNIPPSLEVVVMRLLCKDPDDRFPDAADLLRHLEVIGK